MQDTMETGEGTQDDFRCGFVALAGLPNVGKSTLMNALLGQKISIATSRPQTTRNRILGVSTVQGRGQIIYVDTPGLHKPHKELNAVMVENAMKSIRDTELVLFVVDVTDSVRDGAFRSGTLKVAEQIKSTDLPVVVVLNKIDKVKNAEDVLEFVELFKNVGGIEPRDVIAISALKEKGLDVLRDAILEHLPRGPQLYPEDMLTDQAERFIASEIIREKLTLQTKREIPYSSAVMVTEFSEDRRRGLLRMRGVIYVERDSQKGIVIGKGGSRLKQIGSQARAELEKFFDKKVFLDLHVKVERDWAASERSLRRLGYSREDG